MLQPHSQKRSSSIRPPRARNASTPFTTRASSRRTPSSSLKRTRWRIMRTLPGECEGAASAASVLGSVGNPRHEVTDGLGGVRYALEPYLDVVGGLRRIRDDHVEHEDDEHIDGDLLRIHRHRGLPCDCRAPWAPC